MHIVNNVREIQMLAISEFFRLYYDCEERNVILSWHQKKALTDLVASFFGETTAMKIADCFVRYEAPKKGNVFSELFIKQPYACLQDIIWQSIKN